MWDQIVSIESSRTAWIEKKHLPCFKTKQIQQNIIVNLLDLYMQTFALG